MLDSNCDVVAGINVVAIVTLVTEQQKSHDESPGGSSVVPGVEKMGAGVMLLVAVDADRLADRVCVDVPSTRTAVEFGVTKGRYVREHAPIFCEDAVELSNAVGEPREVVTMVVGCVGVVVSTPRS